LLADRSVQHARQQQYNAKEERFRRKYKEDHPDPQVTQFDEKPFGGPVDQISDKFLKRSAVSIGLFNGT
jgi:hypothetical protein